MLTDRDKYTVEVAREIGGWTNQQRVEFFDYLTANFCRDCGCEKEPGYSCHCTNDE
jgi:hypothetical protein